uniref:Uncharacterized protein n=1 Tax=Megaselia scalaris TaxID=36166 RepID=T1GEZ6_MEGSC
MFIKNVYNLFIYRCLGISSPFINFHGYQELLVNDSISLNVTKDEQALMHQEGLKKMGTLIKPNHIRDEATGFVKANYTKKISQPPSGKRKKHWMYNNPVQEELDQKQIYILDEDVDENGLPASLTEEDKKFIVPMALKTPSTTATTTTSTTTKPTTQRTTTTTTSESNINDLKNHILFLQNMTKHDTSFQSKFVVFPGMQKDRFGNVITTTAKTTTTTTTRRTTTTTTTPRPTPTLPRRFDDDDMMLSARDKITIIPQVLLLNDQSPPDDVDEAVYGGIGARKKDSNNKKLKQEKNQQRKKDLKRNNRRNLNPLRACVKNPLSLKCERQKRGWQHNKPLMPQQPENCCCNGYTLPSNIDIDNISELTGGPSNQTVHTYTDDDINLNPENCQKVAGFTYGQRKLCLRHISVMPAISRGARAAIQ